MKVRFQNPTVASKCQSTIYAITPESIVLEERIVGLYQGNTNVNVFFFFLIFFLRNFDSHSWQVTVSLMNGLYSHLMDLC